MILLKKFDHIVKIYIFLSYLIKCTMPERVTDYINVDPESKRAQELFGQYRSVESIIAQQAVIFEARRRVNQTTNRDVGHSEVTDLDSGVAGQYELASKKTRIDTDQLTMGTQAVVIRILRHEERHHTNKVTGDNHIINSLDVEEGLTEMSAANDDGGSPMTYHSEIAETRAIAAKAGVSITTMLDLYCDGQNAEINAIIAKAGNDNSVEQRMAA